MGIFDGTPKSALQLAHLNDAFAALRSDGGGARQAPAAMQALQKHQAREKAAAALQRVQQGGGLPLGFNSPAFQAYAADNPEQAVQLMAQQAITPPTPASKPPASVQEYNFAKEQGFNGTFRDWITAKAEAGSTRISNNVGGLGKAPAGYAWDNADPSNPQLVPIPGGPADRSKRPTEQSSKMALFGNLMKSTMPTINDLEGKFDPSNAADHLAANAGAIGEFFKSSDYQKYEASARAWAEGVLRIQTGAAATAPEIERVFKTYFAVPGNDAETVALKRQLRSAFADSLGLASGGLINPNDSLQPSPAPSPARKTIGGVTYEQRNGKWGVVK